MRLDGQVALITGAGRGIGQAIALAYAREGARLALVARSTNELEDTARQAQSLGVSACVIPADVSIREQVDSMVTQVVNQYSTIDILVNNAGINGPVGVLQDNDPNYWVQTLQVNLIGTYFCCRAVLPVMLNQDRGQIINITGGVGSAAYPHMSAYPASKVAVSRLTEGLATELAQTNIHVNSMEPGGIHTRMVDETQDQAAVAGLKELYEVCRQVSSGSGDPIERTVDLALFLACGKSGTLSGRLISVSDDFDNLPDRIPEITGSDIYQLRRVELP